MSGSWREAWKTEYFFLESAPAQTKASSFSERCSRHQSTGFSKKERDDLRRTFATRMLEQGCDLFILQRAMGHTSVATTSRYDYRGETSREEVCKHLDVFL